MDKHLIKFVEFDNEVRKLYDSIPLRHLSMIEFDGKNSATIFSEILRKKTPVRPLPFSDFKIHDELDFITKDIKYLTALTYFFRPYIDNPYRDGVYHQTITDKRYLMFTSLTVQCIYNFWDRIGDLLDLYFRTGLPDTSIYFGRVLNNMPKDYKENDYYTVLYKIYKEELTPFIATRDEVVHYYQLECKMYWGAIEHISNREELKKLQNEKDAYPDLFKKHLELTFVGFENVLRLIDLLPDTVTE